MVRSLSDGISERAAPSISASDDRRSRVRTAGVHAHSPTSRPIVLGRRVALSPDAVESGRRASRNTIWPTRFRTRVLYGAGAPIRSPDGQQPAGAGSRVP